MPARGVEIVLSYLAVLTAVHSFTAHGQTPIQLLPRASPRPQYQYLFRAARKNHPDGVTRYPSTAGDEAPWSRAYQEPGAPAVGRVLTGARHERVLFTYMTSSSRLLVPFSFSSIHLGW